MPSNNRILTTTQDKLFAKVADGVLNSNVLFRRLSGKAQPFVGERLKLPIKIGKNNNNGSFSGSDVLPSSAVDNRRRMDFEPKFFYQAVEVPLTDLTVNSANETQIINLLALETTSAMEDMADSIGDLFYGDGTGNSGKDFNGLENLVDDGTNSATIGGLTRATFPAALNSTVTDSSGTLTIGKMRTLYDNVTSGSVKPTVGITTETVFSLYDQLLEQKARYTETGARGDRKAGAGFTALDFRGVDIIADEKCTSGVLYLLNERFLDWYACQSFGEGDVSYKPVPYTTNVIEGNDYEGVNLGFHYSGFIHAQNQAVVKAKIMLAGELITNNPKRHGKLTGITGV